MPVNKLIILTLVANVLTIIGAGHGIAFLGILEFVTVFTWNNSADYTSDYDKNLPLVSLLSLLGQMLLVVSIFFKRKTLILSALMMLWIAIGILVKDLFENSIARLSFFSSTPFLALSIILFQKCLKKQIL